MLVDFMIIGAQKCATGSLAAQLANHHEICFCKIKEPGYFSQETNWRVGLEAYHKLFTPEDGQICGEASTMYTFLPEIQQTYTRLYEYNPSVKLIYIMRQPVERVISNYAHRLARGHIKAPPQEVVFTQPELINRSRYGVQIRPYLDLFSHRQILLLIFEEYIANQQKTLLRIANFLNIDPRPFTNTESVHKHKSVGESYLKNDFVQWIVGTSSFKIIRNFIPASIRRSIKNQFSNRLQEPPYFSPEIKQTIWRFVEDDVCFVETLLGRQLDVWRQNYN